jgi:hypothetical protein
MMRILKNTLASAALASLLAVQPIAAAAQAAPAIERTGAEVQGADELRGAATAPFAVVVAFLVLLLGGDAAGLWDLGLFGDDDEPTSP